jgi:hypothetical protein
MVVNLVNGGGAALQTACANAGLDTQLPLALASGSSRRRLGLGWSGLGRCVLIRRNKRGVAARTRVLGRGLGKDGVHGWQNQRQ